MKKLFVLLFVIHTPALFAQSTIRLGAYLDPVVSWFSPKTVNIDRDGSKPGFSGGLIFESYFSRNYAFVTGASFTSLAGNLLYKEDVDIITSNRNVVPIPAGTTVAINASYLTLPVSLKLKTNEMRYFTYYAQLGFSPQVNIGSRATAAGGLFRKESIPKEINLLNVSFFFGGGFEYHLAGQTSLLTGLFFNNGFVDVLSNNRHKAVFNYFTFRIGMMF